MKEKIRQAGALSSESSGGSKTVAGALGVLLSFALPEDTRVYGAAALTALLDYALPNKLPWKK